MPSMAAALPRVTAVPPPAHSPAGSRFTLPVERVAELVRGLTFAASHPHLTEQRPLTAEEIVDVILHGVLVTGRTD